jgi:hypothetical protein
LPESNSIEMRTNFSNSWIRYQWLLNCSINYFCFILSIIKYQII